MKPDPTEEDAFRSLLAKEAAKERTLVQQLARPGGVALQALQLAGVGFGDGPSRIFEHRGREQATS